MPPTAHKSIANNASPFAKPLFVYIDRIPRNWNVETFFLYSWVESRCGAVG
jgi:hypothetical protein